MTLETLDKEIEHLLKAAKTAETDSACVEYLNRVTRLRRERAAIARKLWGDYE